MKRLFLLLLLFSLVSAETLRALPNFQYQDFSGTKGELVIRVINDNEAGRWYHVHSLSKALPAETEIFVPAHSMKKAVLELKAPRDAVAGQNYSLRIRVELSNRNAFVNNSFVLPAADLKAVVSFHPQRTVPLFLPVGSLLVVLVVVGAAAFVLLLRR